MMRPSTFGVALLLLICAQNVSAFRFLGAQRSEVADFEQRSEADSLMEANDESFWTAQWHALESELLQLQEVVHVIANPVNGTEKAAPGELKNSKSNATIKKSNASTVLPPPKPASAVAPAASDPASDEASKELAKVQGMVKGLTGKAMLAPMLEMLKGLYQEQKKRIGDLNKREQQSKKRFEKEQDEFNKRMNASKAKHDAHRLDDEFFKNETRDYTKQFKYWEGVRSRNKRQYHNALKITHGMMQREKDMIAQYERALKTPLPQATQAKVPEQAPEVDLLQKHKATAKFCREVLVEVHSELARWTSPLRKMDHRLL